MSDCIFCKISSHETDADIVFEDEDIIAFKDINPKAPVHILVVPKKHIASIKEVSENNQELLGKVLIRAKNIASGFSLSGYKLIFNVGRDGGQIIDHVHLHLLGKQKSHDF